LAKESRDFYITLMLGFPNKNTGNSHILKGMDIAAHKKFGRCTSILMKP